MKTRKDSKKPKSDHTLSGYMVRRGRAYFAGREEEVRLFRQTLRALKRRDEDVDIKRVFNVWGQGGTGKTMLLSEFERVCEEEGIECIYIDAKRETGESILDLIDLMRSIRSRFSQTRFQAIVRSKPFSEFDQAYRRYKGLEEKIRQKSESDASPKVISGMSKIAVSLASEGAKAIPGGQLIAEIAKSERVQESVGEFVAFTAKTVQEWLVNAFGNVDDAEFFQRPERLLVEKLSGALESLLDDRVFVLLLDTYEELIEFDAAVREELLARLNIKLVPVISGRYSLYDRSNLNWRSSTHFLEMKPFTGDEVFSYLRKRSFDNLELARCIHNFTRGLPLAVGLAVDTVELIGDANEAGKLFKEETNAALPRFQEERLRIIDQVTDRFLSQVPETERCYVWAAAVLGSFDDNSIKALSDPSDFDKKAYEKLIRYSFIVRSGEGFAMHDLVQDYVTFGAS